MNFGALRGLGPIVRKFIAAVYEHLLAIANESGRKSVSVSLSLSHCVCHQGQNCKDVNPLRKAEIFLLRTTKVKISVILLGVDLSIVPVGSILF